MTTPITFLVLGARGSALTAAALGAGYGRQGTARIVEELRKSR